MTLQDQTERWKQVSAVFAAALEKPTAERSAFLDTACAGAPDVRHEVEMLLAHVNREPGFLESPAGAPAVEAGLSPAPLPHAAETPAEVSLEGTRVKHYLVRAKLGEGGMGVVYLADDTRLGRPVALKALRAQFAGDAHLRERLQREARAAAALSHPFIAAVYALEEDGPDLFLITEYIRGPRLRDELAAGPLTMRRLLDVAADIARALAVAHARGIVHRDLKPENVMLPDEGGVKIVDFGLARGTSLAGTGATTVTRAGMLVGTPAYMSPEQIEGRPVDFRTDLFAFGVLVYEAASGVHPFSGYSLASTIANILDREPIPLTQKLGPSFEALEAVIDRCLKKAPDERYSSTEQLVRDLEALRATDGQRPSSRANAETRAGDAERASRRFWWEVHHVAVSTVQAFVLIPLWALRAWMGGGTGDVVFFVALCAAVVAVTLRLHLVFSSRNEPESLDDVRRKSAGPMAIVDVVYSAGLLGGAGLLLVAGHAGASALVLIVALANTLALLVIEPTRTRAAFGRDDRRR